MKAGFFVALFKALLELLKLWQGRKAEGAAKKEVEEDVHMADQAEALRLERINTPERVREPRRGRRPSPPEGDN